MIKQLYDCFQHWSDGGSVWIISDTHFEDNDCKLMDKNWISPVEQVKIINELVYKNDTLIHLGDTGNCNPYMNQINAHYKVLIMGNHQSGRSNYTKYFNEIYDGALFIGPKLLLSHEPVGVPFALNIHGHDHNNKEYYKDGCKYLNLAANVCNYTPVNLGKIIKDGILSDISSIHRITIDNATDRKKIKQSELDKIFS